MTNWTEKDDEFDKEFSQGVIADLRHLLKVADDENKRLETEKSACRELLSDTTAEVIKLKDALLETLGALGKLMSDYKENACIEYSLFQQAKSVYEKHRHLVGEGKDETRKQSK